MKKEERQKRILARGEHSNQSHIITGDVDVITEGNETFVIINDDQNASLKHLLEREWTEGSEVWTKEHTEIPLKGFPAQVRQGDVMLEQVKDNKYKLIIQREYNPYEKAIQQVKD